MTAEAAGTGPASPTADREIVLTRVLEAPRELVFRAFTDPEHVVHWWGPDGFTTTIHEMDVRPGGVWRFIMHGPDGTDYPNRVVYREVAEPERLVYVHDDDGAGEHPPFDVTATFEAEGGGTRVTLRMVTASPEVRARMVEFGAVEGGNQTLRRLAEYLAQR